MIKKIIPWVVTSNTYRLLDIRLGIVRVAMMMSHKVKAAVHYCHNDFAHAFGNAITTGLV